MQGIVKKKTDKGFGFITIDGAAPGDRDLFFHGNSLVGVAFDSLPEGSKVSFDVEDSPKGKNAVNVKVIA